MPLATVVAARPARGGGAGPMTPAELLTVPPPAQPISLDESHAYCKQLSRKTARNFYYSFLTLPADRFRSMCAVYAFMRLSDDLGDDGSRSIEQRADDLERWRDAVSRGLAGETQLHPILPALREVIARHQIPHEYLFAVIDGVQMDLQEVRFETFDELSKYCYHVAGAVGLCCIHVWGFKSPRALELAIPCGMALQLTNILRDLKEDAAMGRVYLPREDLERFGYSIDDLCQHQCDDRFRDLMRFEVARTRGYYAESEELFEHLEPVGKPILATMLRIYRGLLDEIERRNYDVFGPRIRLSSWRKLCAAAGSLLRRRS
jgi:phytoene synthase